MDLLKSRYNYIGDAYYQLGICKIRDLNYNVTLIKRELIKISDKPHVKKIIEFIIQKIGYCNPVDINTAKLHLEYVYKVLDVNKKATASRLNNYFITREFSILKNGKTIKQIELIKEKSILKD